MARRGTAPSGRDSSMRLRGTWNGSSGERCPAFGARVSCDQGARGSVVPRMDGSAGAQAVVAPGRGRLGVCWRRRRPSGRGRISPGDDRPRRPHACRRWRVPGDSAGSAPVVHLGLGKPREPCGRHGRHRRIQGCRRRSHRSHRDPSLRRRHQDRHARAGLDGPAPSARAVHRRITSKPKEARR